MASSFTSADILKGALQKSGEKTDGTSVYQELAIKFMNNAHLDILSGGSTFTGGDVGDPWPWAVNRAPKSITLMPPFNLGNATVTNGSNVLTFSIAPNVSLGSLKDWHFKSDSSCDYYRIATHTAGATSATLETTFADSTATTTFNCYKLIYSIGTDILRLCAPIRIYRTTAYSDDSDGKIYGVDKDTLDDKWPLSRLCSGVPDRFAEIYQSETEYLIRINKFVLSAMKVDMDFIAVPADLFDSSTSIPLIPKQKRVILEYATAYFLCQEKQLQDAQTFFSMAGTGIKAMQNESARQITQTNRQRGQLVAREDQLGRNRYRGIY